LREINDQPQLVQYLSGLTHITNYTGFILKTRLVYQLSQYYILNYSNLESLADEVYKQLLCGRLRDKYFP